MNKQDVIKMAREAAKMYPGYSEDDPDMDGEELKFFTRFAGIVAKAEREKCAKVCEGYTWADRAAEAIRAMEGV